MSCSICLGEIQGKSEIEWTCASCSTSLHKECVQHYLETSEIPADCPNCHNDLSEIQIFENFDKDWVKNTYSKHLKEIFLAQEKALIPDTQDAVRVFLELERLRKQIFILTLHKGQLKISFEFDRNGIRDEIVRKRNTIDTQINILKDQVRLIQDIGTITENAEFTNAYGEIAIYKAKDSLACGVEDCKGFLDSKHVCMVCQTRLCSKCGEILGKGTMDELKSKHECNPEHVLSFVTMKKETKGCPKCGVRIQKSSGCDHMFCTECKTCFKWSSLAIQVSNSNPHYWEWVGQNPDQRPDMGIYGQEERPINVVLRQHRSKGVKRSKECERILTFLSHIITVESRRYTFSDHQYYTNLSNKLQNSRILFILKRITEKGWKNSIYRTRMNMKFKNELHTAFSFFEQNVIEFLQTAKDVEEKEIVDHFEQAFKEFNTKISLLCQIFGEKELMIYLNPLENWVFGNKSEEKPSHSEEDDS